MEYDEACLIVSHCILLKIVEEVGAKDMIGTLHSIELAGPLSFTRDNAIEFYSACGRQLKRYDEAYDIVQLANMPVLEKDKQ